MRPSLPTKCASQAPETECIGSALIKSRKSQSPGITTNVLQYIVILYLVSIGCCQPSGSQAGLSPQLSTDINTTLSNLNDDAVYVGQFQSLQQSAIFDWITEQQGEIHLNIEKLIGVGQSDQEASILQRNLIADPAGDATGGQSQQIMERIYKVWFLLFNPKYITEELLQLEFEVWPSRLAVGYDGDVFGNQTKERCVVESETKWGCKNTRLNYSKYWRRSKVEEGTLNYVNIDYSITIEGGDTGDYSQYKFSFEMVQSHYQPAQVENSDSLFTSDTIHLTSEQPLVLKNRMASFTAYSIFVMALLLIQIVSARQITRTLANNHMMATKFSLTTISFCTVFDLSSAIDYSYRAIQTNGPYYKIIYALLTIASIILYFGFDIQLLTRVLIAKFNNRNADDGRANLKKFLIIFYLGFFISYEGYVLLKAFFQYEWWFILLANCLIMLPQIIRNARCGFGGEDGFNYFYVIGLLATRMVLTLYEHACPANYLKIKPYVWLAILLSVLLVLQLTVLFLQSKYGAIFFIPKFLRPGYYNYSTRIKVSGDEYLECAICLHDLRTNPLEQEDREQLNASEQQEIRSSMLSQIVISRTPCSHIFHEKCLKSWMQVKLECPICRSKLPML